MVRKLLAALALVVALGALLVFSALRDDRARDAVGERSTALADADGAVIHYFAAGPPSGPVVLLVPSYARSTSDFNELVAALNAAGQRTLAVQPRGIDGSSLPSLQTTLHTYAADLAAVLASEGMSGPVVVIGHAYGNRVARTFASDFPEHTRALVLLAAGGEEPTPPEMTGAISRALFRIVPDSVRRNAIDAAFFAEGNAVPEHWLRGWYPRAGLAQAGATQRTPYAEWGAGGSAPILVLQPAEDRIAATGGALLARRHPERVRLVDVPGAGHAILPERPDVVAGAIVAYLESLP